MSFWPEKRTDLMLQIKDIYHKNEHRKHLIQLCIMRAQCLNQDKSAKFGNGVSEKTVSKTTIPTPQNSSIPREEMDTLQKKVHGFELQVASLKMKLSTKEQAHAAKIDELKETIERLKSEGPQLNISKNPGRKNIGVSRVSKTKPRLSSTGSPVSRPTKAMSLFFANSPFSDLKSGRGNSFSGVEITSVASQASLKLSHAVPRSTDDVFSPNNSSAESTPKKTSVGKGPIPKEQDHEPSAAETLSTSMSMTVSDPDETFQSANATFDTEKSEKKTKRKKIRLVSSEASKLILALSDKGLDGDGEDLNSVKYYQDDNFESSSRSPGPAPKRPIAAEPVAKKKHVFKIA